MGVYIPKELPRKTAVVTVCRGRLEYLKVALPTWLSLSVSQVVVVVVDAACPQGTGAWARGVPDERVRVVEVMGEGFNLSAARNSGAAEAFRCGAEVVAFLDADILTSPQFGGELTGFKRGEFLRCGAAETGTAGQCVVNREDFERVGGYDEAYRTYGDEDLDLYRRLRLHGISERRFHAALIRHLPHGDELRALGRDVTDLRISRAVTGVYGAVKLEVMRLVGAELSLEERRRMFDRLLELLKAAQATGEGQVFEFVLPEAVVMGTRLEKTYRVVLRGNGGGI